MAQTIQAIEGSQAGDRSWQTLTPRFCEGPGWRALIGLLVLSTDAASEFDLKRYTQLEGVECFVSRMPMSLKANKDTLAALEDEVVAASANLLPWAEFDAIAFCCTTGSVAVGPDKIQDMVHSVKPKVPVCNPVDSALNALDALNCQRVAVMTPYVDEVNETLENYFVQRGIELTDRASFKQDGDPQMNRIDPECLLEEAVKLGSGDCDGLFISCTGLCTSDVVQRIEDQLGKPVVTSNQALSWATLRAAGVRDPIDGFGQLFKLN